MMRTFLFNQLGEDLPDLTGQGHNTYEAALDVARNLPEAYGPVDCFNARTGHYAISTHGGTGLCQIVAVYVLDHLGGVYHRGILIGYAPDSSNDRNPYSTGGARASWERGFQRLPATPSNYCVPYQAGVAYRRWLDIQD